MNIQCDTEVKQLIREQIISNRRPLVPFQFSSLSVSNKVNEILVTTEKVKEEIYMQLAAPYLINKLHISSLEVVDYQFKKNILNTLSDTMHI